MRFRLLFIIGIMLCALTGCNSNNPGPVQGLKDTIDDMLYDYESEKVFRNNDFSNILEGKKVPVEIQYGMGGEFGYKQWSTKDPKIINEYIEAFRDVKIKEVITNEDDMIFIFDGIEDYIFVMEDGSEIVIGTDCSTYVIDGDIQYVLENNEKLFELNELLRGY